MNDRVKQLVKTVILHGEAYGYSESYANSVVNTISTILKETCEAALPEKKNGCSTHHSTVRPKMFCSSGECLANSNFNKAIDQTKANLNNLLGGYDE